MSGAFSENVLDRLERLPVAAATNGDKIRTMTDEKLAEFLVNIHEPDLDTIVICNKDFFAENEILDWLKSDAEA